MVSDQTVGGSPRRRASGRGWGLPDDRGDLIGSLLPGRRPRSVARLIGNTMEGHWHSPRLSCTHDGMLSRVGTLRSLSARRAAAVLVVMVGLAGSACVPPSPETAPVPPYAPAAAPGPYAELDLRRDDGRRLASFPDPEVLRVGDRWYLYGTTSGDGFEAWSSEDLASWRYEGFVWRPTPGSWNAEKDTLGGFWAPNVVADPDGGFLLYYSAALRVGVARSESPAGPFVDLLDHPIVGGGYGGVGDGVIWPIDGLLGDVVNQDDYAIDAFALNTSSGERYLYFSYRPSPGFSVIGVVQLSDAATVVPGSLRRVLDASLLSWEGINREAPWVEERDGRFWLTYSGSLYFTTCYAVGEAVADSPLGPFRRVADGPFLADDPAIGFYGPGHHSFTTGPDGNQLIFFHTRNEPVGQVPRPARWAAVEHDPAGLTRLVDPPGLTGSGRSSCWPFPLW